jgi:hypothetical protein
VANTGPSKEPKMPDITPYTPRESYTIAGQLFSIPQPYKAGHIVTEGEASQLNQVYAENVRNNKAAKVKELVEAGTFDQEVMQGQIDDYCDSYEMGVRSGGGGRSSDPVMAEAMNIARDLVRKALKKAGYNLSDVTAGQVSERAKRAVQDNPQIVETARQRVEATKEIAEIVLGELAASEEQPAGEEAAAFRPAGRKAKTHESVEA